MIPKSMPRSDGEHDYFGVPLATKGIHRWYVTANGKIECLCGALFPGLIAWANHLPNTNTQGRLL